MNRTAMILMAAWLAPVAAFAQDWKDYAYSDQGFAVQFPAPPSVEKSAYKTPDGGSLPMTRYSVRQEGIDFAVDVVDFSSAPGAANPIAETEKAIGGSGKVTVAIDARINREFGRELSVDGADGSRSAVAIFFVNKRLYRLVARALPPNAMAKSGDAIRFQQSLQFVGDDGGGFGGFGRFRGQGGGGFRGAFNPEALSACAGKAAGDAVQLNTPGGPVPATCTLIARPNRPPGPPAAAQNSDRPPGPPPAP
jgi:hypothetical protein